MKAKMVGNTLTIEVELFSADKQKPSKSGRSIIAYNSGGFLQLPNGYRVSVCVLTPREKTAKEKASRRDTLASF